MSVVDWNPWHGCTKISSGCKNCYVYRIDKSRGILIDSSLCRKNSSFNDPIKKNKKGEYKIPQSTIYTCFQSDFLLKDADEWRGDCFKMMKERSDCYFIFFTKRIDRLQECLPSDWGDGYDNVIIGCTVENQERANYRLPIFLNAPIKHRMIVVEPFLENIDISMYLCERIEEVCAGGESGENARDLNYEWVLNLREQCINKDIPFSFHQTGAHFIKDGIKHYIKRFDQHRIAKELKIDYKKVKRKKLPKLEDSKQLSFDFSWE